MDGWMGGWVDGWIRFPFDNQVIAQRAGASGQTYGESLFEQLLANSDAYSDYRQACDALGNSPSS